MLLSGFGLRSPKIRPCRSRHGRLGIVGINKRTASVRMGKPSLAEERIPAPNRRCRTWQKIDAAMESCEAHSLVSDLMNTYSCNRLEPPDAVAPLNKGIENAGYKLERK
jgi:hypothetical protein